MSIQAQLWAKSQKGLNSGAKFVLWVLADYADARGASCFPSIESIAADTEQGYRTVLRHLDNLEAAGLIERFRERRDDGTLGRYSYVLKLQGCQPHANLATGTTCQKVQKPHANLACLSNDEPPLEPPYTHTQKRVRAIDVLENVKDFALGLGFTDKELPSELESIDTLWTMQGVHGLRSEAQLIAEVRRLLRHQANRLGKKPRPIASDGVLERRPTDAPTLRFGGRALPEHRDTWESVCASLPQAAVRNWLANCTFDGFDESGSGCLELYAPNAFIASHISTHLTLEIQKIWAAQTGRDVPLRVAVLSKPTNERQNTHELA